MEKNSGYYTQKGYARQLQGLSSSMEDYLEMICRDAGEFGCARVGVLAQRLHVRPSSASKMMGHLRDWGLVGFEKYGVIIPTEEGWKLGRYLLHRHRVVEDFLCLLNGSPSELRQAEQIEHFISEDTVANLERLLKKMKEMGWQ